MAERIAARGAVPIPAAERPSASSATVKLAVATKALAQIRAENTQLRADNARLLGELMTLRRNHEHDNLVRANPQALAVLHHLAQTRIATCARPAIVQRLQDTLTFAGHTFWASISLDFTDEHYHLGCPHCPTRLAIVIGDYGHYSAIRDYNDGDIHRLPLHPAAPADLTGIGRWMHDTAVAGGDMALAEGLTYLFGRAGCGAWQHVQPGRLVRSREQQHSAHRSHRSHRAENRPLELRCRHPTHRVVLVSLVG